MIWNEIFEFLAIYGKEIFSFLCLIISVVFYIIKRRPTFNLVDSIKEDVLEILPVLINNVECDGNGQRKKNAVVELVLKYVKKKYHFDFSLSSSEWLDEVIESILSTPQKKGND